MRCLLAPKGSVDKVLYAALAVIGPFAFPGISKMGDDLALILFVVWWVIAVTYTVDEIVFRIRGR
jgi:hypothetical protein